MKTKKYRLETVLGVRSRARDEAARQVAVCLHDLEAAETELARCQKLLRDCIEKKTRAQLQLNEELTSGIRAQAVLAHQIYLNDLKKQETELQTQLENQLEAVKQAEKALAAARENLTESARELQSIETHKTNWKTAREREENRREQKISDEIGAILHGRRDND